MTAKTRAQLNTDADTSLPDNTTGLIDADDVRDAVKDLADSMFNPLDDSITVTPGYREVTSDAGATAADDDEILGINKTIAGATTVTLGLAGDRDGLPLTIKDVKGDAATNNITITFAGGELADGLDGTPSTGIGIINNYGFVKLYPRSGGWYML